MSPEAALQELIRAVAREAAQEGARAQAHAQAAAAPAEPSVDGRSSLPDDRAWSVAEVAYYLNYSKSLVRKLELEGRLPALPRISRRLTFDPLVVKAFRAGTLRALPLRTTPRRR